MKEFTTHKNMSEQKPFEEEINKRLKCWRREQLIGLILILTTFFFIHIIQPIAFITVIGIVLLFHVYYRVRGWLKCPRCSTSLSYLVLDISYAGTLGILILPSHFPEKVKCCPNCGFCFNEKTQPEY